MFCEPAKIFARTVIDPRTGGWEPLS